MFSSLTGLSRYTRTVENTESSVVFDESFQWPVARPIEADEVIDIHLYNRNKYLNNRLVGTFRMILQELIEVGNVKISDCLLDTNNVAMKTTVTFELTYTAPDGSVGQWQEGGFENLRSDELRCGLSIEEQMNELNRSNRHSIGNTERDEDSFSASSSPSKSIKGSLTSLASKSSTRSPKRSRGISLGTVARMAMLLRQKSVSVEAEDDQVPFINLDGMKQEISDQDAKTGDVTSVLANPTDIGDDRPAALETPAATFVQGKRGKTSLVAEDSLMKSQDFQVCVTIIEARQLVGLNMDPVVCVQVGDQKKFTSVKESTNCPYYNEYFVFDFHMPPLMLFDKIISLSVLHSRNFLRSSTTVGNFKLDVATVYRTPDHMFYHKWAILMDPDDISAGVKGYLKCDIAVIGKGDSIKVPAQSSKEDDDIEW
ncbi:hypothetical protein BsWGS_02626 [Bradybaena similaris]